MWRSFLSRAVAFVCNRLVLLASTTTVAPDDRRKLRAERARARSIVFLSRALDAWPIDFGL